MAKEREINIKKEGNAFNHRPLAIKFYSLLATAFLAVVLIGVLELVTHKLPQGAQPFKPNNGHSNAQSKAAKIEYLGKRQLQSGSGTPSTSPTVTRVVSPAAVTLNTRSTASPTATPVVSSSTPPPAPLIPPPTAPPAPCGLSSNLTDACLATGCLDLGFTVTECAPSCTRQGIWPWKPFSPCPLEQPAAPCGFSSNITSNCADWCNYYNIPMPGTECTGGCRRDGIWPFVPTQCPPPIQPDAPCGWSESLTVECRDYCTRRNCYETLSCQISLIQCSPLCTDASIWPVEPVICPSSSNSSSLAAATPLPSSSSSIMQSSSVTFSTTLLSSSITTSDTIAPSSSLVTSSTTSPSSSLVTSSTTSPLSSLTFPPINSNSSTMVLASTLTPAEGSPTTTPMPGSSTLEVQSVSQPASQPSQTLLSQFTSVLQSIVMSVPELSSTVESVAQVLVVQSSVSPSPAASNPVIVPQNIPPSDTPITVLLLPTVVPSSDVPPAEPLTLIIENPSVVLPILGSGTLVSSSVVTNAEGKPITVPVTLITPLATPAANPQAQVATPVVNPPAQVATPAASPQAQLSTSMSSIVVPNADGSISTVPVQVIKPAEPSNNQNKDTPPATALQQVHPVVPAATGSSPREGGSSGRAGSGGGGSGAEGSGDTSQVPFAQKTYTITKSTTFVGGYLPIVVARIIDMGWTAIHGSILSYQPFVQLNLPGGAPGTILLGSSFSSVWYSWLGYGAVTVLTPFAAESIFFDSNYACSLPDFSNPVNPCWPPRMSINTPIIRVLQTLLGLIALAATLAAFHSFRRPSGISANPTSIATVASMMGHPEVLRDFQLLNADTTEQELKEFLKNKKYKLGTYVTEYGTERYGIIPAAQDDEDALSLGSLEREEQQTPKTSEKASKWSLLSMWKSTSAYRDGIFLLFVIAIMGICASYIKSVERSVLARLFQYSSVGRRLVFTVIGMITKSNWSRLLQETQTASPYLALSHQDAHPKRTILLNHHTTAVTTLVPSLFKGQHTTFIVAFTAVLAEFLVVALSGLPYRSGQVSDEFFFCGISALIILAVMVLVLVAVALWRRALPHLPRTPDSTAGVMTYLADSGMVRDFEGVERMSGKERDAWVERLGKRYEYGLRSCPDGKTKWVVDHSGKEEELEWPMAHSWMQENGRHRSMSRFD